jgi:hypothetical protein
MVDATLVKLLALALPRVDDESAAERLSFSVAGKGFAWTYLERVASKKPRLVRPDVLAVRCSIERKEMLIEAAPETFFDDDHYRGFPAVLVRLESVDEVELAGLLDSAWRLQAPKVLLHLVPPPPQPPGG